MKFWPFPMIRNYGTSRGLSRLFSTIADQPDLQVSTSESGMFITVVCSLGSLRFWSTNAYYAWASEGQWRPAEGRPIFWIGEMPSRWAVRKMSLAVDKARFPPSFECERVARGVIAKASKEAA